MHNWKDFKPSKAKRLEIDLEEERKEALREALRNVPRGYVTGSLTPPNILSWNLIKGFPRKPSSNAKIISTFIRGKSTNWLRLK